MSGMQDEKATQLARLRAVKHSRLDAYGRGYLDAMLLMAETMSTDNLRAVARYLEERSGPETPWR